MTAYVLKRLGVSLLVLLGLSFVVFMMLHFISESPARAVLGQQASPEAIAAFNTENGYDRPVILQYFSYLGDLLRGDLGRSYKLNEEVSVLLWQNIGRSAVLSLAGLVLAIVIAIPLGIAQAVRKNTFFDRTVSTFSYVLYAMPSFLIALLLIAAFSQAIPIFPAEASQTNSPWAIFIDPVAMALPLITLAVTNVVVFSQYQRSAALEQLGQDYIKVARAKGMSERMVLSKHLLRNACIPLITLVGLQIPILLAGNLIVESVFNYPGLGLLFLNSLHREDYPVLLAYTLLGGALTVAGNFFADLVVARADRRIELKK
ncbi:MAG: ABC transporter permease [Actinobacteria bacterium]|nr:ABC transporter permease [Actinomycetota bacterium]